MMLLPMGIYTIALSGVLGSSERMARPVIFRAGNASFRCIRLAAHPLAKSPPCRLQDAEMIFF